MPELQIVCLGELKVTAASTPLPLFQADKIRALLPYLALEPQVHQRAELAQFLWPGYRDESARNSLRQALHQLRQTLAAETDSVPWLLLTRQTVQINPDAPISVDVLTFRRLLTEVANHAHPTLLTCASCLARLRQAVELYRGSFLADFTVADSAPFEEWRTILQEQLHIQVREALTQLGAAAEAAEDDAQALHLAHRLLTLEPGRETTHRQLMRLLAKQGQRSAAIAQYQSYREMLAAKGGGEPEAETTALYEQIRGGAFDKPRRREEDTKHEISQSPISSLPVSQSPIALPPIRDWAEMPAVDFFVERSAEVKQLTTWLTSPRAPHSESTPAQLISILGMGGIGKTTLAAVVTKAVAPSFAVVIWRSLLNAPPLSQLLRNWLQILSRQTLTSLPDTLDEQLRLLLTYLQQGRCLLVLDNSESIFAHDTAVPEAAPPMQSRAGVVRPGYEGYDQLFQRLANSDHQSCLLLTSREQPYALVRLGRQAQSTTGRVRLLLLAGLDQQAGQVLLESNGLQTSPTEAAKLIKNYSGNPLALQIVAATIVDFFGGDVVAFQQEEGQIFDGMRLVLDQQFARLSLLEREILVWLAIEREAITVPTLRSNFVQPVANTALLEALQALQNRSLLEKRETGFTLQNVIIEYSTEYLVEQVCAEILEFSTWILDVRADTSPGTRQNLKSKIQNSFLNRFALLKAQAREEVRQSQVRLIQQPLVNRLLSHLGKAQLEEQVMAVVQRLQIIAPATPGYIGGNLLNLLLHLGSDLQGRDFSHLALWQVFLAGAYVPGLNLAGADLTGAVFTQRFNPLFISHFDDQGDLLLADVSSQWLRLLRLRDGQLYQEVALPALRILNAELSPGCDAVLLYLADHQLALLDLPTAQLFSPLTRHQNPIWRVCFSLDGRIMVSGDSSGLMCIWDRQNGQLLQERQISGDAVSALAIAPDGVTMASANVAGTILLWSLADQSVVRRLQGHDEEVATLTFLGNGTMLASGSHDLTIGLWDVATGELRQRLSGHTRPVRKSAATATGPWLVTGGGDHFLYVWDWQRKTPQHLLTDHAAAIARLAISIDGQRAATIDLNSVLSLWDLQQGRRINFYPIYHNPIMSLQFTPDGETLVAGCSDGAIYLWQMAEAASPHMIARFTAGKQRLVTVAVHPDGNLIASAGDRDTIALWARSSGRLLHTLQGPAHTITMLAISPNGHWLASGNGDGTVSLWSLPDGRQRRQLQLHTNLVSCCAFSPTGGAATGAPQQRLASGSFDHTLAIWDAESGDLLHHLHGHTNAIGRCLFSHDGQRLISISYDETLRIWDVASGQPLAVWPQRGSGYMALALHPAGEIVAVSCFDHILRLLDLNSGRCLAELPGHSYTVVALTFHPNGQWLASAGSDEMIKLWDVSAEALKAGSIVCRHTLRTPTPYAGMKITGITGISEAQKAALMALGAVEE